MRMILHLRWWASRIFVLRYKLGMRISSKVFYKCRICEKLFDSLAILERHNKIHNAKKFTCAICNKKFVEKFNLKTHMLTHTQERPRECTHCSKKFRS
ncbi:Zinc finger protein [Armadillidium vulgare]|nr:Zinc finger protein [Armadillidium vulgare]